MGNLCGTIAALFVEPIVAPIVAPISQWLYYSFEYDSNIETMKNAVEILQMHRERVQNSVDSARRNGEEIVAHDTTWLENVDQTTEEAGKVLQDEDRALRRCFNGACLNLCLRHQLSQQAKKIVQVIGKLLEDGRWAGKHKDYVDFVSRMSTTKELMEALEDTNTNVIGVWGMAGVGKTTLVREVARQAMQKKLFDEMAMADVMQSPELIRIQGQIADMLDLKLEAETVSGRAYHLKMRLTKYKKILVILDDLWSKLDLEEIGIPSTGCKVILTSRDKKLLSREMGTHKDFKLEELPKEEAWILFKKMSGDCVENPDFGSTATAVAKECAGLPFALVTVSKALKGKNLYEWKDALRVLRRPGLEGLEEMQSTIYFSIELSYKHLGSKEVQDLFLLCAEMDYTIKYQVLLKYCYGLGSFANIVNLGQARNRIYTLVQTLKDKSLLLDCPFGSDDHCHMHDVVRDVATVIASRDHNMFVVRDNSGLTKLPDVGSLKTCTTLSIPGGDIDELPSEMECPELRFFYVHGGDRSLQIPKTSFKRMRKLQVLDLTKMELLPLPASLGLLVNLTTLCLDRCVLGDIAVIGKKLKNLVILSLLHSDVSELPREIGLLTRLRLLDLSHCTKLKVIPPNLLSSLDELEELYMGNSFNQWEAEGVLVNERKNASLAELKRKLTTLEIHIKDVNNLPNDLLFENLERYVIFVGDLVWDSSDQRKELKTLKLKGNTCLQSKNGIAMLLKGTEDLYIDELEDAENLLNESDREGFQQLKHLHIQNNREIKYIINFSMSVVAFPALQTFILENMTSLEEICYGQLRSTSFSNLKILKVGQCDKLKFVFSSSMARSLSQLQELEVRKCSIMGTIVMKEEGGIEDTGTILFPKLIRLALEHLPKLMSFLSTQNPFITDAGEIILEGSRDSNMPIVPEQVVFPILEKLELSSVNLGEIEHNQHRARSSCELINTQATSRFENLSYLQVQGSGNIKYLLTLSTARFMVQLKHLHIIECEVMEEILVTEEPVIHMVLFPQLECLFLKNLPILKRFCIGNNFEFPSLKNPKIEDCPKFVSSGMTVSKELKERKAEESPQHVMQPFFNGEVCWLPCIQHLVYWVGKMKEIMSQEPPIESNVHGTGLSPTPGRSSSYTSQASTSASHEPELLSQVNQLQAQVTQMQTAHQNQLRRMQTLYQNQLVDMKTMHQKEMTEMRKMLQVIMEGGGNYFGVLQGNNEGNINPTTGSPPVRSSSSVGSQSGEPPVVEEDDANAGQAGTGRTEG